VVGIAPVDLFGNNTIMGSKTAERIKGTKGIPYFAGGDGVTTDWECVCGNTCDFLVFFSVIKMGNMKQLEIGVKNTGVVIIAVVL